MMDYKICTNCGEKVDMEANFCGNCKSTSFRNPNMPIPARNQSGLIYSIFYWPYDGGYLLSKSKLGAIVIFTTLFLAAFASPYTGGVILVAIVFAALVFTIGFIVHLIKPKPSRAQIENNDYGLAVDIKNLCFFWQNRNTGEFVLSKAKTISALIFIILFIFCLTRESANIYLCVMLATIFTAPAFLIGFAVHKLTNNNPTNPRIEKRPQPQTPPPKEVVKEVPVKTQAPQIPQFIEYDARLSEIKSTYYAKESRARELIEKRFSPPQLTYTRFIAVVDKSTAMFNRQADEIANILNLASDDTPRIDREIRSKFEILNSIIAKMDDLIDELVLSMDSSDSEVGELIGDMEDLIDSVREYE